VPTLDEHKSTAHRLGQTAGYIEVWNSVLRLTPRPLLGHGRLLLSRLADGLRFSSYGVSTFSRGEPCAPQHARARADIGLYGQPHSIFRGNQTSTAYRGTPSFGASIAGVGLLLLTVAGYLVAWPTVSVALSSLRDRQPPSLAPMLAFTLFTVCYILVIMCHSESPTQPVLFNGRSPDVGMLAVAVSGLWSRLRHRTAYVRHSCYALSSDTVNATGAPPARRQQN